MTPIEEKAQAYAESQIDGMEFANEYERTCELTNHKIDFLAGAAYALGSQWRDAEKEKPKHGDVVLIYTTYIGVNSGEPRTLVEQMTYFPEYGFELKEKAEEHVHTKVVAWMPIPPIPDYKPKGGNDGE